MGEGLGWHFASEIKLFFSVREKKIRILPPLAKKCHLQQKNERIQLQDLID